ncbi:MAG: HEAT repeat domain-containing protein [Anaerolineae bacterium]|nr:HEAT repeat domain-containing protein [Anaerolineae bacterium]
MPLFGPPNIEKLKAKHDVNGLIKALGDQKNSDLRAKAAKALGEIHDTQAVGPSLMRSRTPIRKCDGTWQKH